MTITISNIFNPGHNVKKITLLCTIKAQISPFTYTIEDHTGKATLEVDKDNKSNKKYLSQGNGIKIVAPVVDNVAEIIRLDAKSLIFQGKTTGRTPSSTSFNEYETFAILKDLGPKVNVPGRILAKVVRIYETRTYMVRNKATDVQHIVLKDINGVKTTLSIWENHSFFGKLVDKKVYVLTNLKTDKFPEAPPHNISTFAKTHFHEASEGEALKFEHIGWLDGEVQGKVLGFQELYSYDSCPTCNCAARRKLGDLCHRCNAPLSNLLKDFKFKIIIESEKGPATFVGFKRILNFQTEETDAAILEGLLNSEFEDVGVKINYRSSRAMDGEEENMIDTFERL